ncbi:glycosyltransferase family 4 protein [Vibrio ordalii]|uniref:LPS biosynthesis protein n=1 Tax=Vibrio ordalii FS-238 TaxID=617133 RepID=A0A853R5P9_9VIBR|nr:glycosyltransferase family 4 protein [Vibrio ordalii]OEE41046.1 LPS biosynthesis protein [Vibrio ordalii FS-238]
MITHVVTGVNEKAPVKVAISICENIILSGQCAQLLYLSKNKNNIKTINELIRKGIPIKRINILDLIHSDIVHTHGIKPDALLFFLSFFYKLRLISTLHCNPRKEFNSMFGSYIISRFWLLFLRRFDKVVVLTDFIKNKLIDNLDNTITIHNGVDIKLSSHIDVNIEHSIRSFQRKRKVIFSYGVLRDVKGFDFLIKALPELDNEYCLIIAGDGICRNHLTSLVNKMKLMDRVLLLGHVNKPYNYINDDDIVVFPSRSEGFPLSIIEAMSIGKCPLVTNIGAFLEISQYADLVVFEQDNINSFKKVLSEMPSSNSNENKIIATTRFSSLSCFDEYDKLYRNLRSA